LFKERVEELETEITKILQPGDLPRVKPKRSFDVDKRIVCNNKRSLGKGRRTGTGGHKTSAT
jgi:hypothetical protein